MVEPSLNRWINALRTVVARATNPRRIPPEDRLFFALATLMAAGVFLFGWRFHEAWRDEAQALLIARDTHGISGLLHALRYEAHPPLIHLVFKLALLVLPGPVALPAVGAVGAWFLAVGVLRAVHLFSGINRFFWAVAAGCALLLSYPAFYEFGIIVRGYGLGLGLALIGAASLERAAIRTGSSWRDLVPGWVALGLAATASLVTTFTAIAVAAGFVIVRRRGRAEVVSAALTLAPFFLVVVYCVWPNPDRMFGWVPNNGSIIWPGFEPAAMRLFNILEGQLRINWLLSIGTAPPVVLRLIMIGGLAALIATPFFFAGGNEPSPDRSWFRVAVFINIALCSLFFVLSYRGEYRHHLIAFFPLLVVWLDSAVTGSGSPNVVRRGAAFYSLAILVLWMVNASWMLARALESDAARPFSLSKAAAREIEPGAAVVAHLDWITTGVALYRPDAAYYSLAEEGRNFSFVRWDRARRVPSMVGEVIEKACARHAAVFVTFPPGTSLDAGTLSRLGDNLLRDLNPIREGFELRRVTCGERPATSG